MTWDAIVIGSGFGGVMAAWPLVQAGQRVLMLERGGWVGRGPENWTEGSAGFVSPWYTKETPYSVRAGGRSYTAGSFNCVGGQSVFYGGASYRFRETDFQPNAAITGDSGAAWPVDYDDLEPFYMKAERLLGVAGEECSADPRRSGPFPRAAAPLSRLSARIATATILAGMSPSRIPVAISFERRDASRHCIRCGTCDGYACAAEAKNDLATGVIPRLVRLGMTLRPNSICVRLHRAGERITGVEIVDRITGAAEIIEGTRVILAAGTLATPHLLLSSDLARVNPAGHAVGRYLTRHRNAVVFGVFPTRPNPSREFDKQIAILDHYEVAGSLQQMTPPLGLVRSYLPRGLRSLGSALVEHSTGLIAIAEDQPRRENGVQVDWSQVDRFGLPRLRVDHSYSNRDQRAARVLIVAGKKIMREAGARFTWVHAVETFSHALGTVRMGVDERSAPLDEQGRYRGIENLYVTDGSALPRSASLNPSLTIAANALRIGSLIAGPPPVRVGRRLRMIDHPLTSTAITQP